MARLIPLQDLTRDGQQDFNREGIFDPTGSTAYGADGSRIGTIRAAMVEPDSGRLRYLLVDVGSWFSSKEVLVPVGLARIEDDGVFFDSLTKDQVRSMHEYRSGEDITDDTLISDDRVLRGTADTGITGMDTTGVGATGMTDTGTTGTTTGMAAMGTDGTTGRTGDRYTYRDDDRFFQTPERLRLLEERLIVDKERVQAGSVEISKHVETRSEQVNVELTREEVVIERHPVTDPRPVEGTATLGADRETIRVDLEAERADVRKQAYVTEEVEIGKRQQTETQAFTETVGREVLDVNRTGDANITGSDVRSTDDLRGTDRSGSMGGALGAMSTGTTGSLRDGTGTGHRITAVFNSQREAEAAVQELRSMGVQDAHLSFIGKHGGDDNLSGTTGTHANASDKAADAGKGLLTGATAGALFGLAAAAIPGVGPFITAGALATTLGAAGGGAAAGALVGGAAGTLAGLLADHGYSREEAEYYASAVDRGGVLVAVNAGSGLNDANVMDVLRRHGGNLYNR